MVVRKQNKLEKLKKKLIIVSVKIKNKSKSPLKTVKLNELLFVPVQPLILLL